MKLVRTGRFLGDCFPETDEWYLPPFLDFFVPGFLLFWIHLKRSTRFANQSGVGLVAVAE